MATYNVSDETTLRALLAGTLNPGDVISIAAGSYTGLTQYGCQNHAGTEANRITIQAADPQNLPVFSGAWHVYDCSYLTIKNLKWSECGLNASIDGAVYVEGTKVPTSQLSDSNHIILDGLVFYRTGGPSGYAAEDSLKVNRTDYIEIRNSIFDGWTEQALDFLGSQHGLIEDNVFLGDDWLTAGYYGQSGLTIKMGSNDVVVRRNWFHYAGLRALLIGGSSDLQYFRDEAGKEEGQVNYECFDVEAYGNRFVRLASYSNCDLQWSNSNGGNVHHNTFVCYSGCLSIAADENADDLLPATNGTFNNNVCVYDDVRTSMGLVYETGEDHPGFTVQNNVWFYRGPDPPLSGRVDNTQAKIQAAVFDGNEANGNYGLDPELVGDLTAPADLEFEDLVIQSSDAVFADAGADVYNPDPQSSSSAGSSASSSSGSSSCSSSSSVSSTSSSSSSESSSAGRVYLGGVISAAELIGGNIMAH